MSWIIAGERQAQERAYNERAWLAWHTAAMPLMKRFPRLSELQVKPQQEPRQTWQEQFVIMEQLAAHQRRVQQQIAGKN